MGFDVSLVALVAGNPHKAWRQGSEPNDEWQEQTHSFESLDEAKAFVLSLPGTHARESDGKVLSGEEVTHVVLTTSMGEVLYVQDHGEDDLDAAAPGVVPPSQLPPVPVIEDEVVPDVTVLPRQ